MSRRKPTEDNTHSNYNNSPYSPEFDTLSCIPSGFLDVININIRF